MDEHSLDVLDFPRIREILAGSCATEPGREQAFALQPMSEPALVGSELDRLEQMLALDQEPPLAGVRDIRMLLVQARAGSMLSGRELLQVAQTCTAVRGCREFFSRHEERTAALTGLTNRLAAWPELESEVTWAVDESGEVRDSASPELQRIRGELRRRRNDLLARLEAIVAADPGWFEGPVAVRADRFVLPLRLEQRHRVPGVVHATSGTGQTLFVEPLQTVAEQNEVQELRDAEEQERTRILRHLTSLVAASADQLDRALAGIAGLDLLVAKRRFCTRYECSRPRIAEDRSMQLVAARHPLLLARGVEVVPLDLTVSGDTVVVVLSGPNAGGKTVVLKTVGLFSLMLAAGLFLPAAQGTRLPLFGQVFADIGDEQSLDANLSSFTAHTGRLARILEAADRRSLVLVDEIGASTSPEEGAAIAMAVLETLREAGALTFVTTHFGTLKMFAEAEPAMTNAAMEFRCGPTFRLIPGTPGESSALDIAERTGLPRAVLERARRRMGAEWLELGDRLRALGEELDEARRTGQVAGLRQQEAERLCREYEQKLAAFTGWQATERKRLVAEQERLLRDARRQIENLVRAIRESGASHPSIVAAKSHVEAGLARAELANEAPAGDSIPEPLAPGERVESSTFRRRGEVVATEGGKVTVAFGSVRVALDHSDLRKVPPAALEPGVEDRSSGGDEFRFEPRLDIRGLDRLDAERAVGRFVDDAVVAGAVELLILHGTGTGALRRLVQDRLRRDQRVESACAAERAAGGSGVTLVRLRTTAPDVQSGMREGSSTGGRRPAR